MDIGHISKVANRKRLLDDIQTVGQKVSKENADLIKQQIANDTAFWEMKERLAQKENEYEKLLQNMINLQMEYETLSSKHQEELRLRPEILNKLDANRKIYEVLQEHMERLMGSISRTKADKAALYDAYTKADKVVGDLKQKHIQEVEKAQHIIDGLERTVEMTTQHKSELTQVFSACKQQAEAYAQELKGKLEAALNIKDELSSTVSELTRQLDKSKFDIEKRDVTISTFQRDMKEMIDSFNGQAAEATAMLANKDNELKRNADEIELLKGALANQESYIKDVREQNSGLQETLVDLEGKYQELVAENQGVKVRIEKQAATIEEKNKELDAKAAVIIQVKMELQNNAEELTRLSIELQNIKRDKEIEMAKAEEKEAKLKTEVAQLQAMIKSKDEELSVQLSKFLEMRNESEREKNFLREKQNTLRLKLHHKEMAEETHTQPDDNAVMMTPDHMRSQQQQSPVQSLGVLRRDSFEDMLSSSGHCADGDSLDSQEISRRFAALTRGEPLSPVPLAMLKRRRRDTPNLRQTQPQPRPLLQPNPPPRPQLPPHSQPQLPQPRPIGYSDNVVIASQQSVKKERRFFKSVNGTGKNK